MSEHARDLRTTSGTEVVLNQGTSRMGRWIASMARRCRWRMLCILAMGLLAPLAHANTTLTGSSREVRPDDTPQAVLDAFRRGELDSFDPKLLQRFSRQG